MFSQVVDVERLGLGVGEQVKPFVVELTGLAHAVRVDPVEQPEGNCCAASTVHAPSVPSPTLPVDGERHAPRRR